MQSVAPAPSVTRESGETLPEPATLHDAVKLVIWDLDETLWSGTLSEGPVTVAPAVSDIVRQLNRRGIISSVCSQNDLDDARARLRDEDQLWDEFVFARVSWLPKGPQVAQIIETAQLRPQQVLFIDDKAANLQEARYYVPGIQTSGPEIIPVLLAQPQLAGRDDPKLDRLHQYKLLERRAQESVASEGSHEDFLLSCDIRVQTNDQCLAEPNFERIADLLLRANQLNYTKRRMDPDVLRILLADPTRVNRFVRVSDRFGDYGICGFYSLSDGHLTDFVFSCRILNMGVEQWIYARLGFPRIDVVGGVATPLDSSSTPTWINQESPAPPHTLSAVKSSVGSAKVLLKGACDLTVVNDFLGGSLETEFNEVTTAGMLEHRDHTEILRRSTPEFLSEFGWVIDRLPFLDRSSFESKFLNSPHCEFLVISLLTDYTGGLYRLRGTDCVVPFIDFRHDVTDPELWATRSDEMAWLGLEPSFIEWFAENFDFEGPLSPEALKDNIRWLAGAVPPGSHLVLVNGSEVPVAILHEEETHLRHREMNQALDEVVGELPNASILDVREFITSRSDFTDGPRHYRRRVYLQMAEAIRDLVADDLEVKRFSLEYVKTAVKRMPNTLKLKLPPGVHRKVAELKRSLRRL
jgi:FkbH-like protein